MLSDIGQNIFTIIANNKLNELRAANEDFAVEPFEYDTVMLSLYKQSLWEYVRTKILYDYDSKPHLGGALEALATAYNQIDRGVYPKLCQEAIEADKSLVSDVPKRISSKAQALIMDGKASNSEDALTRALWIDVLYYKVYETKTTLDAAYRVSNDIHYGHVIKTRMQMFDTAYPAWKEGICSAVMVIPDFIAKEYEVYNRSFFDKSKYFNASGYIKAADYHSFVV